MQNIVCKKHIFSVHTFINIEYPWVRTITGVTSGVRYWVAGIRFSYIAFAPYIVSILLIKNF